MGTRGENRRLVLGLLGGGTLAIGALFVARKFGLDITRIGLPDSGILIPTASPTLLPTIDNIYTPTPSPTPSPTPFATSTPSNTPTPEISIAELVRKEWPSTPGEFLKKIHLRESEVFDPGIIKYIDDLRNAGVHVVELTENNLHQEKNPDDSWTGGWLIDPRRDPNKPPFFLNTVYLARNSFSNIQYGFMNPDVFRNRLGFTPEEVEKLEWPWKDNNKDSVSDFVGSGIPANYAGLIEAAAYYPLYSYQDGTLHELVRVLGQNAQTVEQRFAMNINNPGGA